MLTTRRVGSGANSWRHGSGISAVMFRRGRAARGRNRCSARRCARGRAQPTPAFWSATRCVGSRPSALPSAALSSAPSSSYANTESYPPGTWLTSHRGITTGQPRPPLGAAPPIRRRGPGSARCTAAPSPSRVEEHAQLLVVDVPEKRSHRRSKGPWTASAAATHNSTSGAIASYDSTSGRAACRDVDVRRTARTVTRTSLSAVERVHRRWEPHDVASERHDDVVGVPGVDHHGASLGIRSSGRSPSSRENDAPASGWLWWRTRRPN